MPTTKSIMLACVALLTTITIPPVAARIPLHPGQENHTLESAVDSPNPAKSWTLYQTLLDADEPEYFQLQLQARERLKIRLYSPKDEAPLFRPTLVVMGSEITSNDTRPAFLEVPTDGGVTVIPTQRPEAPAYEPFTPASYNYLAHSDRGSWRFWMP